MKWLPGLSTFLILAFLVPQIHAQGIPTGTAHSAVLTWLAPSPVGGSGTVTGYNLYRTPSGPPSYVKLNATPVSALTFTDTTVASGTTYGYCATTVDSSGSESACTVPVIGTIPSNPNAPSGVVIVVK